MTHRLLELFIFLFFLGVGSHFYPFPAPLSSPHIHTLIIHLYKLHELFHPHFPLFPLSTKQPTTPPLHPHFMIFMRSVWNKHRSVSNILYCSRLCYFPTPYVCGRKLLVIDSCSLLCCDLNRLASLSPLDPSKLAYRTSLPSSCRNSVDPKKNMVPYDTIRLAI